MRRTIWPLFLLLLVAVQALSVIQEAGLDPERTNVNGGAVALGHPLGCTGAKLTASLLGEMGRRKSRYGMVTMCIGGGMGAAVFQVKPRVMRPYLAELDLRSGIDVTKQDFPNTTPER